MCIYILCMYIYIYMHDCMTRISLCNIRSELLALHHFGIVMECCWSGVRNHRFFPLFLKCPRANCLAIGPTFRRSAEGSTWRTCNQCNRGSQIRNGVPHDFLALRLVQSCSIAPDGFKQSHHGKRPWHLDDNWDGYGWPCQAWGGASKEKHSSGSLEAQMDVDGLEARLGRLGRFSDLDIPNLELLLNHLFITYSCYSPSMSYRTLLLMIGWIASVMTHSSPSLMSWARHSEADQVPQTAPKCRGLIPKILPSYAILCHLMPS